MKKVNFSCFPCKFWCVLAVMLLSYPSLKADEGGLLSDLNIVERLVSDSTRLAKVENVISKLPKMQFFINPRVTYNSNKNEPFGGDIRRVQFDMRGKISKQFEYAFMAEFAGSPKILNANASWTPLSEINVRVGQYKVPFTLESAYARAVFESCDNSQIVEQLTYYSGDISGISSNGRDFGIGLYGGIIKKKGYSILNYDIGVFNGIGINVKDNNRKKDFVGRLNINPIKPVTISTSYMNGWSGNNLDKKAPEPLRHRERYAVGARYDDGKYLLRSEAILSNTEVNNPGKDADGKDNPVTIDSPVKNIKSYGWYALAGYYFIPNLQGLLKYDYMRQEKGNPQTDRTNYYVGANYFFQKGKLSRLQVTYCFSDIKDKRDLNQVIAQLYVIF